MTSNLVFFPFFGMLEWDDEQWYKHFTRYVECRQNLPKAMHLDSALIRNTLLSCVPFPASSVVWLREVLLITSYHNNFFFTTEKKSELVNHGLHRIL